MDRININELKEYLENALDGLGNAIAVLEDAADDQANYLMRRLQRARSDVGDISDALKHQKG